MTSGSSATPSASPPARPSDSDASVRDRPCPQNANISPSFPSLSLSLLSSYSSLSCCARNCDCDAQIHLSAPSHLNLRRASSMQKLACRTSEENGVALHPRGGEGGGRMRCGANKIPFTAEVKAEGGTN